MAERDETKAQAIEDARREAVLEAQRAKIAVVMRNWNSMPDIAVPGSPEHEERRKRLRR